MKRCINITIDQKKRRVKSKKDEKMKEKRNGFQKTKSAIESSSPCIFQISDSLLSLLLSNQSSWLTLKPVWNPSQKPTICPRGRKSRVSGRRKITKGERTFKKKSRGRESLGKKTTMEGREIECCSRRWRIKEREIWRRIWLGFKIQIWKISLNIVKNQQIIK